MYNSKWHEKKLMRQLELMRMVVALICWAESLRIKNSKLQGNLKIYLASEVAPWVVIAQSTIQTSIKSWPRLQLLTNLSLTSWGEDFSWLLLWGVPHKHTQISSIRYEVLSWDSSVLVDNRHTQNLLPHWQWSNSDGVYNHLISQFLTLQFAWAQSCFPGHPQSHLCLDRLIWKQSRDAPNAAH